MDVRGAGAKGGSAGQEDSAARGHPESGCVNCVTPGPQRSPEPGSGSQMGFIPWACICQCPRTVAHTLYLIFLPGPIDLGHHGSCSPPSHLLVLRPFCDFPLDLGDWVPGLSFLGPKYPAGGSAMLQVPAVGRYNMLCLSLSCWDFPMTFPFGATPLCTGGPGLLACPALSCPALFLVGTGRARPLFYSAWCILTPTPHLFFLSLSYSC